MVFDHEGKELGKKLTHIQHENHEIVISTTHLHMDHHNCLETIIIKGSPPEIEKIAIEIGGLRGVRFAKLTRASRVEL